MKKTWKLINELNSRNCTKTKRISEIKIGEQVVTSPFEMAETFNSYCISQKVQSHLPPFLTILFILEFIHTNLFILEFFQMNGRKQGCRQCIRTVQSMKRVIIGLYL